jgi:hypothetical protein
MRPPISGPETVARAKTAPMYPEYRPRSRGVTMLAITTWTSAVRPPTPRPWTTRAPISTSMLGAKPAISDPMEKMTSADCTSTFLLNRSASLPQIGVVAVIASSVATTTQV